MKGRKTLLTARTRWPDRDDLQRETKSGQYALHSQSIQLVCQQFLANVQTIKQLRQANRRHRYPHHPKRLILPMGRGLKSFSFHLPDLPEQIGAVSLVWRGGYELHLVVPAAAEADVAASSGTTT